MAATVTPAKPKPRSLSLSNAWLVLPPRAMIRAYTSPHAEARIGTDTAAAKLRAMPNASEGALRLLDAIDTLQPFLDRSSAKRAAERELKTWLFWALRTEKYSAQGYPVENGKAALALAELPTFMFEEETAVDGKVVDWRLSTIKRAGHEFISVQVIDPGSPRTVGSLATLPGAASGAEGRPTDLAASQAANPLAIKRGPGRPRARDAVAVVIADMIDAGQVISGPPWIELIAEVRRRGVLKCPDVFKDAEHPGDETIRRELADTASRATSKP